MKREHGEWYVKINGEWILCGSLQNAINFMKSPENNKLTIYKKTCGFIESEKGTVKKSKKRACNRATPKKRIGALSVKTF